MTIHSDHPFLEPEGERDPVRRLRGRVGGVVSLWTSGSGTDRAGLTVSSYVVAGGEPARVLALVDPDSDLADALAETGRAVVQLLRWDHRDLADAFAGTVLAPSRWGVLLVRKGGFAVARLSGDDLVEHKIGQRHVQGRTKAGGQSQQRFARRRDNQARAAYDAALAG